MLERFQQLLVLYRMRFLTPLAVLAVTINAFNELQGAARDEVKAADRNLRAAIINAQNLYPPRVHAVVEASLRFKTAFENLRTLSQPMSVQPGQPPLIPDA